MTNVKFYNGEINLFNNSFRSMLELNVYLLNKNNKY